MSGFGSASSDGWTFQNNKWFDPAGREYKPARKHASIGWTAGQSRPPTDQGKGKGRGRGPVPGGKGGAPGVLVKAKEGGNYGLYGGNHPPPAPPESEIEIKPDGAPKRKRGQRNEPTNSALKPGEVYQWLLLHCVQYFTHYCTSLSS